MLTSSVCQTMVKCVTGSILTFNCKAEDPSSLRNAVRNERQRASNDFADGAEDAFFAFMAFLFGENWLTYLRIVLAVIILVMALKLKRLLF